MKLLNKYLNHYALSSISIIFTCIFLTGCQGSVSPTNTPASIEQPSPTPIVQAVSTSQTSSKTSWKDPIDNLSEDFILGMDVSSVLVEEQSGVIYHDFEGNEADIFRILKDAGLNYIRLRVWNDPYDKDGHGYGGGNNDLPTAVILGKRATDCGMRVCIDFHYSDFWADPKRQHAPKAWERMDIDDKSAALYDYTIDSLSVLIDSGVDVGMVQIGNEINNGMSGETNPDNVIALLKSGSKAVRDISVRYDKDIDIVVHYTNIDDKSEIDGLLSNLQKANLDYDVLGLSYYPFWDGSFKNMKRVIELMSERYGIKVMLAETSYAHTLEDGDGSGNSFASVNDLVDGYAATITGQGKMLHDIIQAVNEVNGIGIFYWEGAWLPVGPKDIDNSEIWETFGSGWASSYASDYDPEDAGLYYGGCSWENQALFDYGGYPLESLHVFKYVKGQ